jgi:hypothetical protein
VITFSYLVISLINSSFQILLERKKITPFSIARKLSECRVKKLIAGYVIKHQPGKSPAENSAMENYLY